MEAFILIFIGVIVLFWFDSLKARETGIDAVREACAADGLQLLDETISLATMKAERNQDGRLVLRRIYQFEYSDTGDNRRRGSVHLLGHRIVLINVGLRLAASDGRLL